MRERVTVVMHFFCHSLTLFSILEKAPFSVLKLTSVYLLGDDLSALNVVIICVVPALVSPLRVVAGLQTAYKYSKLVC